MRTNRKFFFIALSIISFLLGVYKTEAQFGTSFKDGIAASKKFAVDSLAGDVVLIAGGTVGGQEFSGIKLDFNDKNGTATMWVYVYHSEIKNDNITVIVALAGLLVQSFALPVPIPQSSIIELNMKLPYINSDKMVAQLKLDTAFKRFKIERPTVGAGFIFLADGKIQGDSANAVSGFNYNQPIWSVSYSGGPDSSLNCIVGGSDGKAFCQRIAAPVLGVHIEAASTLQEFYVSPNPVTNEAKISLVLKDKSISKGNIEFYDSKGNLVLNMESELESNNIFNSHLLTSDLLSGVYFLKFNTLKGVIPLGKIVVNK